MALTFSDWIKESAYSLISHQCRCRYARALLFRPGQRQYVASNNAAGGVGMKSQQGKGRFLELKRKRSLSDDEAKELAQAKRRRAGFFDAKARALDPVRPPPGSPADLALQSVLDLTVGGRRSAPNAAYAASPRASGPSPDEARGAGQVVGGDGRARNLRGLHAPLKGAAVSAVPSPKGIARDTSRPGAAVKPRDLDLLGAKGAGPKSPRFKSRRPSK